MRSRVLKRWSCVGFWLRSIIVSAPHDRILALIADFDTLSKGSLFGSSCKNIQASGAIHSIHSLASSVGDCQITVLGKLANISKLSISLSCILFRIISPVCCRIAIVDDCCDPSVFIYLYITNYIFMSTI
jgi:hypothetical protein